jgi:uncharacterized protein (TIGR02594 family)
MNRRDLLVGATMLPVLQLSPEQAKAQSPLVCPAEWGFRAPTFDNGLRAAGAGDPHNDEVAAAFRILFGAAGVSSTAIEPAKYFLDLSAKNKDGWLYKEEWPTPGRANPMIVGFFAMTQTLPSEGDQTSWCAAFVNFCLNAAGLRGTDNAMSGSFRHLIDQPENGHANPKTGDVVVFRDKGASGDAGHGHVGFFVSPDDITRGRFSIRAEEKRKFGRDTVYVLGGNQRGSDPGSTGGVKVAVLAKRGALDCMGYVSASSFKKIVIS